ncbi:kinesin-like protein KIF20B [Diprion similis]|uniref:kinesin-like protein KIF20B n=1 Tax=Diprion similis TaxID=362088 RepID=UPI001EF99DC8|nr:kinesin-like protein KIF20B [Diprion similis]
MLVLTYSTVAEKFFSKWHGINIVFPLEIHIRTFIMDNKEIISALNSQGSQNALEGQETVSLTSHESQSNTNFDEEKVEMGLNKSEEDSILTLGSESVISQTIKVYLRLKPFPPKIELTKEQEDAYTIVNATTLLTKFPGLDVSTRSLKNVKANERVCRTFTFTSAFGPSITQTELFDGAIKPQVEDFLAGQSSTVMSYGTSNSGKSYTLNGVPSAPGIIPLSINFVFRNTNSTLSTPWYKPIYQSHVIGLSSTERVRELEIRDKLLSFPFPEKTEFINAYQTMRETMKGGESDSTLSHNENLMYSVWISFAEIYNDAIYDLLSSDCQKKKVPLKMVTDKQGRTFIKDLRMVYVNSDEEAYQVLLAGQYRSRTAVTTLNFRSSRSHCIFTIKLLKYYAESAAEDVEVSALSFCDLAGSGRLKMTKNVGDRLKETQNINTSLLVLGRCLKSIWEGQSVKQKSELVGPFRESKLTRLFQKALSGKEQITLIVNVNPLPSMYAETQNVLNFSAIAKKIIVEPAKEVKKKMFRTRFSRAVSQSVKTYTDWDHAVVEDSTHEVYPEKSENCDYVLRECYEDLIAEHEKLQQEYAELKKSMIDKDLEIREEMANTYTGLINDLEASWMSRSKDVEEQQEHLLAWSVNQVENFYKEKLSCLNSRKRRRWDDGDAVDDREADIREMEAENAGLTAKILVSKETIKELRSARENAIAEKNKAVFELSLLKEELRGVKKMLEAAENDIRRKDDGAHFTEELKRQLNSREERIKNLKEFLNEAKEEYIRITSDARRMQEELIEVNANLIEHAEKIDDLEEQLDQSSVCLAERSKRLDQMTEKLECQAKQLADAEARVIYSEKELKKSESIRLNLMGAVEDLNKLYRVGCAHAQKNSNSTEHNFDLFPYDADCELNVTGLEGMKIDGEITSIETENSPTRDDFVTTKRFENVRERTMSLDSLNEGIFQRQEASSTDNTDGSVYNKNQSSFKFSTASGIDDSGIAVTMSSKNQTMEQINDLVDTDLETDGKNCRLSIAELHIKNSVDELLDRLQLKFGELGNRTQIPQRPESAQQIIKTVEASFDSNEIPLTDTSYLKSTEREPQSLSFNDLEKDARVSDIFVKLEDEKKCYLDSLYDKVSKLEKQLSQTNMQSEKTATVYFNEHEMRIDELQKEISDLKQRDLVKMPPTETSMDVTSRNSILMLSELEQRVKTFEDTLAKCQLHADNQHKQLLANMERLSSVESKIQSWLLQELKHSSISPTSNDESNTDSQLVKDEEGYLIVEKNLQRVERVDVEHIRENMKEIASEAKETIGKDGKLLREQQIEEDQENNDETLSKNCESEPSVYSKVPMYPAIDNLSDDRKFSNVSLGYGASPIEVDFLAASTPTRRSEADQFDAKESPIECQSETATPVRPVVESSLMVRDTLIIRSSINDIGSAYKSVICQVLRASINAIDGRDEKTRQLIGKSAAGQQTVNSTLCISTLECRSFPLISHSERKPITKPLQKVVIQLAGVLRDVIVTNIGTTFGDVAMIGSRGVDTKPIISVIDKKETVCYWLRTSKLTTAQ